MANEKLTQLSLVTSLTSAALFYVVQDVGTVPTSLAITFQDLSTDIETGTGAITALTGDVTATGPGSVPATIANNAVTTAKILNSNVTLAKIQNAAASSRLLGSGASGAGVAYVEISLGTRLAMTGTVLDVSGGGGSVTSVAASFSTGLISITGSPVTSSGTLAFTVTGTSGGIPYFSGVNTWASSALLTANAIILGGGAGNPPATLGSLGTTTTLLHGNAAGAPTFGAVVTADITDANVTLAKIQNATTNSVLLGAGSAGAGVAYVEISLGTNLSMSGTTLIATGGGGTETRRMPLEIRNPRGSTLPGNAFFSVEALTNIDFGMWEFVHDVQGKINAVVNAPAEMSGTPNAKIILIIAANATTGVTSMNIGTKCVAEDAESINVTLTADTRQDVTVPATAYLTKKISFTAGDLTNISPNDLVFVEIFHDGTQGADTLAVNTLLVDAYLEVDVLPA
jgi:uncharacterized protein DUF5907